MTAIFASSPTNIRVGIKFVVVVFDDHNTLQDSPHRYFGLDHVTTSGTRARQQFHVFLGTLAHFTQAVYAYSDCVARFRLHPRLDEDNRVVAKMASIYQHVPLGLRVLRESLDWARLHMNQKAGPCIIGIMLCSDQWTLQYACFGSATQEHGPFWEKPTNYGTRSILPLPPPPALVGSILVAFAGSVTTDGMTVVSPLDDQPAAVGKYSRTKI